MSGFDASEADRRLSNIVQMGVVEQVDYSNSPSARVRVGDLLSGWMRMGTSRAGDAHESWGYSVGEEVLVVSTSGNLAQGVIVCAIANGINPAQAAAGVHKTVYPGGVIIEIANGSVNITAPNNLIVNGDVIADGISLKKHTHPHGDPAGNTGGPN